MSPLLLLGLLAAPLLAVRLHSWLARTPGDIPDAGAYGAALVLLVSGIARFVPAEASSFLALAPGVLELALAAGLALRRTRVVAAWIAILLLAALFPANVVAPMSDPSIHPLHAPLQLVSMAWIYFHGASPTRPLPPVAA